MEHTLMNLPERLRNDAEQALEELGASLGRLSAAVIATTDGFEVASRAGKGVEVSKLAAMACSISALGAMVGQESEVGPHQNVIVEASEGYIVIVDIPHPSHPMILNLVADREEMLGQVLYQAKRTATRLADLSLSG